MKELNVELLKRFIGILSTKKFKKDCFRDMTFMMLYLLDQIRDKDFQATILKFIRKLTDEQCAEISKEKKIGNTRDEFEFINLLSITIEKRLEKNLIFKSFDELLYFAKSALMVSDKKKSEKFISFLNIITKRLPFCDIKQELVNNLFIESNDQPFALLVFERENFPL